MVSILDECIFVHVPKNAGTALSRALGGVDSYWPMHVPWRCLEDEGKPGFGFVRNPWARMHSLYYFLCTSPPRHYQRVDTGRVRSMGFKRWLLEGANWMSNEPVDGQIWIRQVGRYADVGVRNTYKNIGKVQHPIYGLPPQQKRASMWWLDGLPIQQIGRVEYLQDDLERISDSLGFSTPTVRRVNATSRKPKDYRPEYDEEMIDHVTEYMKDDIEMWGYKFDG